MKRNFLFQSPSEGEHDDHYGDSHFTINKNGTL